MSALPRVGIGTDVHAYAADPGRELWLAGLLWETCGKEASQGSVEKGLIFRPGLERMAESPQSARL